MKVFISADMEGVSGLTDRDDMQRGGSEFERGRTLLTGDLNAAIDGAFEGGATAVVINEAHMTMRNVRVEDLDPRAELIRGAVKRGGMMEGLDDTFGAVFFVGYHSKHGTPYGVLNHSFTGRAFQNLFLNGTPVGEMVLNAAFAGQMGVPLVLVTGDDTTAQEVSEVFADVKPETVVVKEGRGRFTSKLLHPSVAQKHIRAGAKRAVEQASDAKPFIVDLPASVGVEFTSTAMAEVCSWVPTVARSGPRDVEFQVDDWGEALGVLYVILILAKSVMDEVY